MATEGINGGPRHISSKEDTPPEPIAMPKMRNVRAGVVNADDPDSYMILVPAAKLNTKRPILQISCVSIAILCAVLALSLDEMSDGDVVFSTGDPEVDYSCGWRSYSVSVAGYMETYDYSGDYCSNNDEVIDEEFCSESIRNGKIWIAYGVIGLFSAVAAIPAILHQKVGGKASYVFLLFLVSGTVSFSIASFWWWLRDQCEGVEEYSEMYLEANFDTSPGVSLYLLWFALFAMIAALLITSLHISNQCLRRRAARNENDIAANLQPL